MHTILGINGSTGVELAKVLRSKGIAVRGVSRRDFLGDWEHVKADVLDINSLQNAVAGSEVVYCCVGLEYNIKVWQRDWHVLIENVIQSCLKYNAKLVFIDNVYMYGLVQGAMTENSPMNTISEKGKVRKVVAEKILDAFQNRGLKGAIARCADFYGPGCATSMLTETVINNAIKGKTMQWVGQLGKKHAFTFTPDIGKAAVNLALSESANGQVWHLPTAAAMKGQDFIDMIAKEAGVKPKVMTLRGFMLTILSLFIPILKEIKEMMYQYDEDYIFSSEKYEKTFNHHPISYQDGLKITVDWYKNN